MLTVSLLVCVCVYCFKDMLEKLCTFSLRSQWCVSTTETSTHSVLTDSDLHSSTGVWNQLHSHQLPVYSSVSGQMLFSSRLHLKYKNKHDWFSYFLFPYHWSLLCLYWMYLFQQYFLLPLSLCFTLCAREGKTQTCEYWLVICLFLNLHKLIYL